MAGKRFVIVSANGSGGRGLRVLNQPQAKADARIKDASVETKRRRAATKRLQSPIPALPLMDEASI